ncbi:hypothetical protein [Kribbella sp. NPDC023855]|uniref:hypothetical protein n=1 Tax=Kribbella sp. NPDC023855 TaxID=3154698 RepID=UPI00340F1740
MIPEESLARLAIAWEACQLSEAARAAVRIDGEPDELLARANEVLRAAERYAATVHTFTSHQATDHQATGHQATGRQAADHQTWWHNNPEEAAADLDDWLLRHQDGENLDPAPISSLLPEPH